MKFKKHILWICFCMLLLAGYQSKEQERQNTEDTAGLLSVTGQGVFEEKDSSGQQDMPELTCTPEPTSTLAVTNTSMPTNTPIPTNTPTPTPEPLDITICFSGDISLADGAVTTEQWKIPVRS